MLISDIKNQYTLPHRLSIFSENNYSFDSRKNIAFKQVQAPNFDSPGFLGFWYNLCKANATATAIIALAVIVGGLWYWNHKHNSTKP